MNTVKPLDVKLNIRAVPGSISVDVHIWNRSDQPVLIEKIDPTITEPLPHEFVMTSDGQEVRYIGPMIKRRPYAREDFRWLKPSEKIERTLSIENLFAFDAGSHEYELVYVYLGYNEDSGKIVAHRSKPVTFAFTEKASSSTLSP